MIYDGYVLSFRGVPLQITVSHLIYYYPGKPSQTEHPSKWMDRHHQSQGAESTWVAGGLL